MPDVTLGPPTIDEVNQTAATIQNVHGRYDPPAYIPMPGPARRVSNASRQKVREITVNATNSIMPAVYGRARVGASIFYFDTFGGSMYIGAAISWGEIEEIEKVTINNVDATSYTSVLMEQFTGTTSQGVSTIIQDARALLGDTTYDEIKPGIAYVAFKIGQAAAPAVSGIPEIKITLKGRKIYDPRTGLTAYTANPYLAIRDLMTNDIFGGRIPTAKMNDAVGGSIQTSADYADINIGIAGPTTPPTVAAGIAGALNGTYYWKITFVDGVDNETTVSTDSGPVVLVNQQADLSNIEIGPAGTSKRRVYRSDDNVNYFRVGEIPNNTDTTFTDLGGTSAIQPPSVLYTKPRFQIGIAMMAEGNLVDWVDTLRAHAPCWITFNGKQYDIIADMPDVNGVIQAFTPDNIIKGSFKVAKTGMKDSPTSIQVKFTDQLHDFIDGSAIQELASIATGADYSRPAVYDLPGVTDSDHANRLCVYYLNARLADLTIGFDTPLSVGVKVLPGDLISITFPVGFSGALFRVMDVEESEDGNTVHVTALEYSTAKYLDYVLQTDPGTQGGAGDPFGTPDAPTSVTATQVTDIGDDGLYHVRVIVDWVNGATDYYKTTRAEYTYDGGISYIKLGDFKNGPLQIENPQIGSLHTFNLYTVSATEQLSAAASVSITPLITSGSVPEVTQLKFLVNKLEFYGPLAHTPEGLFTDPAPAPTCNVTSGFGGGVDAGDHLVATSRVFKWGEGPMGGSTLVTVPGGGPWKIDVSNIDPTPPADCLMTKLYVSKANLTDMYHASDEAATGGTTDQIIRPDSFYVTNDLAPVEYNGVAGWEVFDRYGVANPLTDPMPLFKFIPWPIAPQHYARLDCTPIAHQEADGFVIKVWVRVRTRDNHVSDGVAYDQLFAVGGSPGPPQSIPTSIAVVDGANDDLDIPVDATIVYLTDGGLTAPFGIGGFTVEGVTPTTRKSIKFINMTTFRGALVHNSVGSSAANRVINPDGLAWDFGGFGGVFTGEYDTDAPAWRPFSTNGVGRGGSGVGVGYIWSQGTVDQDAGFRIRHMGIVGVLGEQWGNMPLVDGDNEDMAIAGAPRGIIHLTDGGLTASPNLSSMLVDSNEPGLSKLLVNNTGWAIVIQHNHAAGPLGGRPFLCVGAVDGAISVGPHSSATLKYLDTESGWLVTFTN